MYSVMDIMDVIQNNIAPNTPGVLAIFLPFKDWENRMALDEDVEAATMVCEDGRKFLVTVKEID